MATSSSNYYKSHLDNLGKENKQLKQKLDKIERENRDLKKSIYDLTMKCAPPPNSGHLNRESELRTAGTTWPRPCQAVAIPGRRIITTTCGLSRSMSTRRYFPIHHSIRPPSQPSTRIPLLRPRPHLPPSSTTLPTMHPASARVRASASPSSSIFHHLSTCTAKSF
jgi:hypothetical protein